MALTPEEIAEKIEQYGIDNINDLFTVQDTYILQEFIHRRDLNDGYSIFATEISKFRDHIISVEHEEAGIFPDKYFVIINYIIYRYDSGVLTFVNDNINNLTNSDFEDYGNELNEIPWTTLGAVTLLSYSEVAQNVLVKLPPYKLIQQLYEPELYILCDFDDMDLAMKSTNLVYQISTDGLNFYCYNFVYGNWYKPTNSFSGILAEEVAKLNAKDLAKLIPQEGNLYIRAILNTYDSTKTPVITDVMYTLGEYYEIGNCVVYTTDKQMSIVSWEEITGVEIVENKPNLTQIYYALSVDNRTTWRYYKNEVWTLVALNNLYREGMTRTEFIAAPLQELNTTDSSMLDVAFCLVSTNYDEPPTVTSIKFTHNDTDPIMYSNFIRVPVPDEGFRNVLEDEEYILKLGDGLAFNEPQTRYDLYTTPKGIKLRPLDIGTIIGGVESGIYAFEVLNGYEDIDCNITLTIRFANQEAIPYGNGCRLPDVDIDRYKTYVEMSAVLTPWDAKYPIKFRLNRDSTRIIFIKVLAKLVGDGTDMFQVRLVADKV